MSTPEQPATPALTRKQMRDIRNTGATPIVTGEAPSQEPPAVEPSAEAVREDVESAHENSVEVAPETVEEHAPASEKSETPAPPVSAPLPRAAVPAVVHDLPGADASVDLGVAPLTRRQARQQERIRTASVPVITPEVAAAHAASVAAAAQIEAERPADETAPSAELDLAQIFEADAVHDDEPATEAVVEDHGGPDAEQDHEMGASSERAAQDAAPERDATGVQDTDAERAAEAESDVAAERAAEAERAVVNPGFGAELLAGGAPQFELPPSFDQLISRSVPGSVGTGNALILSQTPSAPPLVAPVTATGEVMITGSYNLPEGLGSTGHANGTADGKETDAVLVDGELPAHSSPTPIAASAAISTVKNGGDIIKPPTPEKGGRLMLTLAITAGVLALALVGVLILAFVTGVF